MQELQRQNQILHEEMEQVGLLLFYDVNVLDIHCSSFALERYFILCGEFYEGYTLKSCMCHVVVQSHGVTAIEVSHLFSHSSSCVLVVQSVSCLVNSSSCVVIVQSVSCLVNSSSCVVIVQSVSCLVNSSSCVVVVQSVSCLVNSSSYVVIVQ